MCQNEGNEVMVGRHPWKSEANNHMINLSWPFAYDHEKRLTEVCTTIGDILLTIRNLLVSESWFKLDLKSFY